MTRFRCPSVSTISSTSSVASIFGDDDARPAPSVTKMPTIHEERSTRRTINPQPAAGPSRKLDKGKARADRPPRKADKGKARADRPYRKLDKGKARAHGPSILRAQASKEDIRMAIKRAEVRSNKFQLTDVWVGNLSSHIDEKQLEEKFKHIGTIVRITIRASRGICVPTAQLPRPYFGFGERPEDVHYASISFRTMAAARRAIELNGTEILGRQIVVSFNVKDMPDYVMALRDLINEREGNKEQQKPSLLKRAINRLTAEKTELVIESNPRKLQPVGIPIPVEETKVTKTLAQHILSPATGALVPTHKPGFPITLRHQII